VLVLLITDFAAGTRVPVNLSVYRGGGSPFQACRGCGGAKISGRFQMGEGRPWVVV